MAEGRRPFLRAADGPLPRTGAEELAAGSGPSAVEPGAMIDFVGSKESVTTPRAVIELGGKNVALPLGERGQTGAFGQVLAQQAVGVLVRAALPGMVGQGEVDGRAQTPLQGLVHVELRSVVRGKRANAMSFMAQNGDRALQRLLGANPVDLADADQAALAFDDGDGGGLAAAVDRVDLPVPQAGAPVDHGGTLRDHALARQPATTVVAGVALALDLASQQKGSCFTFYL